jgi:hypothetical protein
MAIPLLGQESPTLAHPSNLDLPEGERVVKRNGRKVKIDTNRYKQVNMSKQIQVEVV